MKKKKKTSKAILSESTDSALSTIKTTLPSVKLEFDLESGDRLDSIEKIPNEKDTTCLLQRGNENWLSRFSKIEEEKRPDEIKQEVRALFAKWLKMQNVCLLLGAGASFYVTGFLCSGLFYEARKLLANRRSDSTLKKILKHSSKPNDIGKNFEVFLSQLTAWCQLSKNDDWPLDKYLLDIRMEGTRDRKERCELLSELILDLERSIVVTCNVELPPSELSAPHLEDQKWQITPHEALLAKMVTRDPQQGRAKIFTLNYDTLIEQAMDRLGILYSDGFSGIVARRFNPSIYNLDFHYPGEATEGRVRRYDKVLQLFKLHGSINWRHSGQSIPGNPYGIEFDNKPLPTHSEIKDKKDDLTNVFGENQSLAILPTSGKYGETLTMPFAHMFRAFGQALQEPQTVLMIIGYGGWDLHLNRIVEDALTNPSFTCAIVDPYPSDWVKRLCYSDHCGRVYYLGGYWGKFEYFASDVLPDMEVLRTELDIAKQRRDLQRTSKELT